MIQRANDSNTRIRALVLQSLLIHIPKTPSKAIVVFLQLTHDQPIGSPGFDLIKKAFLDFLRTALEKHVYYQTHDPLYDPKTFIDQYIMNLFYCDYFMLKNSATVYSPHLYSSATLSLQQTAITLFENTLSSDDLKCVYLHATYTLSPHDMRITHAKNYMRLAEYENNMHDIKALQQLHRLHHPKATLYLLKHYETTASSAALVMLCGYALLSVRHEDLLISYGITHSEKNEIEQYAIDALQKQAALPCSTDTKKIAAKIPFAFFKKQVDQPLSTNIPLLALWLLHFTSQTETIQWTHTTPRTLLLIAHEQYDLLKSFCISQPQQKPLDLAFLQQTLTCSLHEGFKQVYAKLNSDFFVIPLIAKEHFSMTIQLFLSRQISAKIEHI